MTAPTRIKELVKLPDYVSLASVTCGVISMLFSSTGKFTVASAFLIAAVFCDWIDGKIAALMNRREKFGIEMNSLADAVSFATAPAIFAFFYRTERCLFHSDSDYFRFGFYSTPGTF